MASERMHLRRERDHFGMRALAGREPSGIERCLGDGQGAASPGFVRGRHETFPESSRGPLVATHAGGIRQLFWDDARWRARPCREGCMTLAASLAQDGEGLRGFASVVRDAHSFRRSDHRADPRLWARLALLACEADERFRVSVSGSEVTARHGIADRGAEDGVS